MTPPGKLHHVVLHSCTPRTGAAVRRWSPVEGRSCDNLMAHGNRNCGNRLPDFPVRIFATIHFCTDELWERHRFIDVNKNVKRVSPSIHLKNTRDTNPAISALHELCQEDASFPLHKRVSWSQNMQKGELISALSLALIAQMLHGHRSPIKGRSVHTISDGLANVVERVTAPTFRRNVSTFIKLINECWPLATIEYRKSAPQVKQTFMTELARLLSRHPTFWEHNDNTLVIGADDRRKQAKFPINDPKVAQLAGTGGAARKMLYQLLVDHLNSGRRTQRLRSRFEAE